MHLIVIVSISHDSMKCFIDKKQCICKTKRNTIQCSIHADSNCCDVIVKHEKC